MNIYNGKLSKILCFTIGIPVYINFVFQCHVGGIN